MSSAGTRELRPLAAGRTKGLKDEALCDLLGRLYREQLALDPDNGYLHEHAHPRCVSNQVRTFHWYRPYLAEGGRVLDWGCNHAPDSCLLRAWFGDRLNLHSCDFVPHDRYRVFHDFARQDHHFLEDEVSLPYPSNTFDTVLATGVLEHTAMDYESLKELYRVVRPDGVLVISYLPNWLSLKEWHRRVVRKREFHRRLYGLGEARQLLKRSGFYPVEAGYHTYLWERVATAAGLGRWRQGAASILGRLLPLQVFSSTLCLIARKVRVM